MISDIDILATIEENVVTQDRMVRAKDVEQIMMIMAQEARYEIDLLESQVGDLYEVIDDMGAKFIAAGCKDLVNSNEMSDEAFEKFFNEGDDFGDEEECKEHVAPDEDEMIVDEIVGYFHDELDKLFNNAQIASMGISTILGRKKS